MRYFLDTEFIESGPSQPIHLISIALVAEDGRELYLQNRECDFSAANDWVRTNVLSSLVDLPDSVRKRIPILATVEDYGLDYPWLDRKDIANEIINFIGNDPSPEFWGYYSDYDWIVFCQIFGTMVDLPSEYWQCRVCEYNCKDNDTMARHILDSHSKSPERDTYPIAELIGRFPMFCLDLKQSLYLFNINNIEELIPNPKEHHALEDARWNKKVYDYLVENSVIDK